MSIVKKTDTHVIYQRRDGRYAVKTTKGAPVNGDDKVAILQAEGYLKAPEPKPEEPAEEAEATEEAEGEE